MADQIVPSGEALRMVRARIHAGHSLSPIVGVNFASICLNINQVKGYKSEASKMYEDSCSCRVNSG